MIELKESNALGSLEETDNNKNIKMLVLGGVESVKYASVASESGIAVDSYPHLKRFRASRMSSYEAIVCLTAQLSHSMVRQIKTVSAKKGIPIYYLPHSSKSGFRCFLKSYCGDNCIFYQNKNSNK